jgi:hypothetical protein
MLPYPKLFLGGYGPVFSARRPQTGKHPDLKKQFYSFEDLIDESIAGNNLMRFLNFNAAYRSVFARDVRAGLRCGNIDFPEEGASLETFVRAKLFLSIRAEARFLNLINEFGYYLAPFVLKELHDPFVRIPLEYRKDDEFQIRLIHALAPGLLDDPLDSGGQPATIDRNTFRFVRAEKAHQPSLLRRVARFFLRRPDSNQKIVASYSEQVMSDPHACRWFTSTMGLSPKEIARVLHYLVGIDTLGYSSWVDFTDTAE